jgi:hypothetical protein
VCSMCLRVCVCVCVFWGVQILTPHALQQTSPARRAMRRFLLTVALTAAGTRAQNTLKMPVQIDESGAAS